MIFNCGCCSKSCPEIHRHVHHILPRATGGSDDPSNLIALCPSCHDLIHAIAIKLAVKKYSIGRIQDSLSIVYQNNTPAINICLKLASNVREAVLKTSEQGMDKEQDVTVSLVIKKRIKDYMFLRAREMGVPLNKYLRQVVMADLIKAYPALKSEIK